MLDDGYIDEATYQTALASPLELRPHPDLANIETAAYFTEEVRRLLYDRLGGDVVNNSGLRIETTLDIGLQRAARKAVRKGLVAHDHRRGYRGPLRKVEATEIPDELARLGETNVFLSQPPEATGVTSASNTANAQASDATASSQAPTSSEPVEWPEDKIAEGVVLSVNRSAKTATIGLGPDIEGLVRLSDVSWAREPNENQRSRPVEQIEKIFSVGDVAQFIPLEGSSKKEADAPYALELWQEPTVEGALLSLENETGNVLALIGGYDFARSEFNRAVQAQRQPGSAFKPFIYGAALTRGYTPVSTVIDRPVVYTDPVTGFVWAPRNYGRKFHGPMTMRDALKKSINNATVHLFRDLGVRYVIDYARRFGIQAPLSSDLSLALGSSAVTLLELTRAYAVYPAGGKRVIPRFIVRVVDREGNELLKDVPLGDVPPPVLKELRAPGEAALETYPDSEILPSTQIISPADAYLVSDLLRAVVNEGTGRGLKRLGRTIAGKTGTTNDYSDAWFMGFSPELTTGVWVGHDDNTVLGAGESGGKTALPIWGDFMEVALAPYPHQDFKVPENIEFQRIDKSSGLLADSKTTDAYFQPFLTGTAPERSFTDQTDSDRGRQAARDDFF
jgi:penicillin-binding protein 1A